MKDGPKGTQLTLDFIAEPLPTQPTARIVPFVDSATLEARREAVRWLANAGIFAVPPNLKFR